MINGKHHHHGHHHHHHAAHPRSNLRKAKVVANIGAPKARFQQVNVAVATPEALKEKMELQSALKNAEKMYQGAKPDKEANTALNTKAQTAYQFAFVETEEDVDTDEQPGPAPAKNKTKSKNK